MTHENNFGLSKHAKKLCAQLAWVQILVSFGPEDSLHLLLRGAIQLTVVSHTVIVVKLRPLLTVKAHLKTSDWRLWAGAVTIVLTSFKGSRAAAQIAFGQTSS